MTGSRPTATAGALPDPGEARSLEGLIERLQSLKVWAGNPSYNEIKDRINVAWRRDGRPDVELAKKTTVADCFRTARRRVNTDLLLAVVDALHPEVGYVAQWRQALRTVVAQAQAGGQVRARDDLPTDLPEFTGRDEELRALRRWGGAAATGGDAVVISAIEGMAGVGKTQLAVHAAHRFLNERLFDRALYVDLRGFHPDPGQPPAEPTAVLDGFLRLLGVPAQQIPFPIEARTALYRRRLAGTRTLVVLDNAAGEDQVEPLLPGTPGCLTLITSRRRLPGLPAADHLMLDVFTPDDALDYLAGAVPGIALGGDPAAPTRIAHRCGYLPLALSLIASHMRAHPGWTLTDHADRIDERHRHHRLDDGVELALHLSYQNLSAGRRRTVRLLTLHPGRDFDAHTAAALAGTDPATAATALAGLYDDHLLQQTAPGRYAFHDLVRAFLTNRGLDEDPPRERRDALDRLFDFYHHSALAAAATAVGAITRLGHDPVRSAARPLSFVDRESADAWLDGELANLVAVAAAAAGSGPHHAAWQIADALRDYFWIRRFVPEWLGVAGSGLAAAVAAGDLTAEAGMHNSLGVANWCLSRYDEALRHFHEALRVHAGLDDPRERAGVIGNLAGVYRETGDLAAALDRGRQSMELVDQLGDRVRGANVRITLSGVSEDLGLLEEALGYVEQALRCYRELGNADGEGSALLLMSAVQRDLGRLPLALDTARQSLAVLRGIGARLGEACALAGLASVVLDQGLPDEATAHAQAALELCRGTGNDVTECEIRNCLADIAYRRGDHRLALDRYAEALDLADRLASRSMAAVARTGQALALCALGDHRAAVAQADLAIELATRGGYRLRVADGLGARAQAQLAAGDADGARDSAARARRIYRASGCRTWQALRLDEVLPA